MAEETMNRNVDDTLAALAGGGPAPRLNAAELAAVLVMLLGENEASGLLGHLSPEELKLLGERMCQLGEISPEAIIQAVDDFVERTEKLGIRGDDRVARVEGLMRRAVGDVKAENLMQRILPDQPRYTSLELTRWLNPEAIVPLIKGEHPQAVAVLLIQLEPDVAAKVLAAMPADQQAQIVHRVATMGPVQPEALAMLEELLARRLAESQGGPGIAMGGTTNAAEIINNSGKVIEKRVMPEITKMDKVLAKQIESEMFKFEHLYVLDPQSMGSLLREVESDTLIIALKGIPEENRDVFFRAMSSRAADGVKDEIASRGRIKMADCIESQKAIIAIARNLAAEGVIAFGAGGEDEYV